MLKGGSVAAFSFIFCYRYTDIQYGILHGIRNQNSEEEVEVKWKWKVEVMQAVMGISCNMEHGDRSGNDVSVDR